MLRAESDLSGVPRAGAPDHRAVRGRGRCRRGPARAARSTASSSTRRGCWRPRTSSTPPSARSSPRSRRRSRYAVDNIRRFHERQKPEPMWLMEIRPGAFAGERWTPIPSVACYVPRGKGAFPVGDDDDHGPGRGRRRARDRRAHPAHARGRDRRREPGRRPARPASSGSTGRRCRRRGRRRLRHRHHPARAPRSSARAAPGWWRPSGCSPTGSTPACRPGPSEAIVLADATADPDIAALDLLIEAEHGPDSSAYPRHRQPRGRGSAPRRPPAGADRPARPAAPRLRRGGARRPARRRSCSPPPGTRPLRFVNDYAPEHLEILSAEPLPAPGPASSMPARSCSAAHADHASPTSCLGPDCVLPTGGWARGPGRRSACIDFMKRTGLGHVTARGYPELAPHARALAAYEGFEAHAMALTGR